MEGGREGTDFGGHRGPAFPAPEKPLEVEQTKNGSSMNSENLKNTGKGRPSKFKSIFTKRRGLSQNAERATVGKGGSAGSGKGDNSEPKSSQQQSLMLQGFKDEGRKVPSIFMINGDSQKQAHTVQIASTNETREVQNSSNIDIQPERSSRGVEKKKEVTIAICEDRRQKDGSRRSNSRSGIRTAPPKNSRDQARSQIRKSHQMKQKNKELLNLVEELTNNCEYYRNALKYRESKQEKDKYEILKENESLNLEICKLCQAIDEWREKCQKMENKSTALTKAKNLAKENRTMLEDIEVLKTVICRLNKELAFYQDKLRVRHRSAPENMPTYSTSSGSEFDDDLQRSLEWLKSPSKSLLPLLTAYDETIAEKDEIIRDHELALDRFKARSMEIIRENEDLHKLITESKQRGTISIDEWESLRSNAVLVLEENDLLHEQVSNYRKKEEVMLSSFQEKSSRSKLIIGQLEADGGKLRGIISELEIKGRQISEDNLNLSSTMQTRIPKEKHDSMVQEFKQTFEELKSTYLSDRQSLCDKNQSLEKERDRLVGEITTLETDNVRLRGDLRDCENQLDENTSSLQQMKSAMIEVTSARDATNGVIEDFMKHVQQLVSEKNKVMEDVTQQKLLNEQIMTLRSKEIELVAELHGKIEDMERLHNEEIRTVHKRGKELEESFKFQYEQHRIESSQLKELLKEKEKRVQSVETEKKQLEHDLETVWRTTTNTMQTSLKSRRQ